MAFAPPPTDDQCREAYQALHGNTTLAAAAASIGITVSQLKHRSKLYGERGLAGTAPVIPGFRISKTTAVTNSDGDIVREFIQQRPELGEAFDVPPGHAVKGVSALVDADGRTVQQWIKTDRDREQQEAQIRAVVDALSETLPREEPVLPVLRNGQADLANQFTITDLHMGMLAWGEETGAADWDMKIAEKLLFDWFSAAIRMSPDAMLAILAQLGDLLHYDSHETVTPAHRHVLDSDSRYQKMIRVIIRAKRRIVKMLLETHERVHMVEADANHDPAGGAWLREMLAAFYDNEPRITVDTSPSTYYAYEHGLTALFYHHGHRKKIKALDSVFAGKFREIYGRTKFAYAHTGHLHSDELISTNIMKVERHETLAAPDAYAANGGWLSGRSAKVITYSKRFGEVGRITLTPEMVAQ